MVCKKPCCLIFILIGVALFPGAADAQTRVVRADRMLDVVAGRVVSNVVVVVEGERIVRVGGSVPRGAEVIDLGDVTLVPGLTDLHTHFAYDIEGDWTNRTTRNTDADAALRGARNAIIIMCLPASLPSLGKYKFPKLVNNGHGTH